MCVCVCVCVWLGVGVGSEEQSFWKTIVFRLLKIRKECMLVKMHSEVLQLQSKVLHDFVPSKMNLGAC